MPNSSDTKKPKGGQDSYVRTRDHPKIKRVVELLSKASDDQDLLHPSKLGHFTLQVAKELANDLKWYKVMTDEPEPAKNPLYRSLFDHLYSKWVEDPHEGSFNATQLD